MPLEPGKSKESFGHNVKAEISAGKPQKQAVAIAYSEQRRHPKAADGAVTVDQDGIPLINGKRTHPEDLDDQTFAAYAKMLMGHVAAAADGATISTGTPTVREGYTGPGETHQEAERTTSRNLLQPQTYPYGKGPTIDQAESARATENAKPTVVNAQDSGVPAHAEQDAEAGVPAAADGAVELPTPEAEQSYADTSAQLNPSGTEGTDAQFAQAQKDLQASMDGPSDDQVKQAAAKLQAGPDVDEQEAAAQAPVEHAGQAPDLDAQVAQAKGTLVDQLQGPSDEELAQARAGLEAHQVAEQNRAADYDKDPDAAYAAESQKIREHIAARHAAMVQPQGQPAEQTPTGGSAKEYQEYARKQAKAAGLDPSLPMGVIEQESGWNPTIVGDGGNAVGLGQFHKPAAIEHGLIDANGNDYRTDPYKSIDAVIRKLKKDGAATDPDRALLKYNGGGDPNYIQNVQNAAQKFGGGGKGILGFPGMVASSVEGATEAAPTEESDAAPDAPADTVAPKQDGILAPQPPAKPWQEGAPDTEGATSEQLSDAAKDAQASADAGGQKAPDIEMPPKEITAASPAPTQSAPTKLPPDPNAAIDAELSRSTNAIRGYANQEAEAAANEGAFQGAADHYKAAVTRQAAQKMQDAYDTFQKAQANGVAQAGQQMQDYRDSMQRLAQTRINPNQYWSSLNAGQKFGNILGVLVAGFSGNPNDNMAMDVIQKNITRDIEAQKANYGIQKDVTEGQRNLFSMTMDTLQHQQAATIASSGMLWKQAATRLESAAAMAQSPIDAQHALGMSAQANMRGEEAANQAQSLILNAKKQTIDNAMLENQARITRDMYKQLGSTGQVDDPNGYNAAAEKWGFPKRAIEYVPKFADQSLHGKLMTPDVAKNLSDGGRAADSMDTTIKQIREAIGGYPGAVLPSTKGTVKLLVRDLSDSWEKLAGAGITSRSDPLFQEVIGGLDETQPLDYYKTHASLDALQAKVRANYARLLPQTGK